MTYQDFSGLLVVDFPTSMLDIDDFAKKVGIKTDGLTLIGFEFYAGENHPDRPGNIPPKIKIYLLAVPDDFWKSKYENFGECWVKEKTLKTLRIEAGVDLFEFYSKYLKRFEARLVWPTLSDHDLKIEY